MNNFIKYFGALFMEKKDGAEWAISIGRTAFWSAFIPALHIWIANGGDKDITSNHLTILLILAAYNMGKKGLEVIKSKISEQDGPG